MLPFFGPTKRRSDEVGLNMNTLSFSACLDPDCLLHLGLIFVRNLYLFVMKLIDLS